MVVLCRGQFYWFDVLDDNSDLIMTEKDLALNLQVIVDDAEQIPIQEAAKGSIGVLTTENRKVWASLRDIFTADPESNNADCLGIVDAALFILCLDYTSPTTGADLCTNMLCGTSEVVRGVQVGTCTNRWYDKLQIIVCKNGSAGINFEHTGVDGHTVLRMASDVYTDTILRFARTINGQAPSLWASTSPDPSKRDPASFGDVSTTPHKLEWDMVPSVTTALRFAETRLADLIQQNEFQTLDFAGYGKNFMTSMGFSPDAFVQMAFQAAYYGLYGRLECTYEPAMTKLFLHGRTEAIRTVTPEVANFVQLFWGEHAPGEKIDALRKACQKHTAITKNCAKALGQDRHLYALYCVWQRAFDDEGAERSNSSVTSSRPPSSSPPPTDPTLKEDLAVPEPNHASPPPNHIPAIFADGGWSKINNTILSTSNCGNPSLRHFGFGPTSADGFGIGYIIKDESVSICASSKHRQTKRFVEGIEGVFLETRKLLRALKKRGASGSGGKMTRAREIEDQRESSRKVRGRVVHANRQPGKPDGEEVNHDEESDEDGLGGCECKPTILRVLIIERSLTCGCC
jgi:carnitine O-acetyltransferase